MTQEEYRACNACSSVSKVKGHAIAYGRKCAGNKKDFYMCISRRRKIRENLGLLLNRTGDYLTNIEKTKVFNAAFASVFTYKSRLQEFQVPETCIQVQESLAVCGISLRSIYTNWTCVGLWVVVESEQVSYKLEQRELQVLQLGRDSPVE